jgi:hypothetical protein
MHVCIHVYVYVYVCICEHLQILFKVAQRYTFMYVYACMHACINIHIHISHTLLNVVLAMVKIVVAADNSVVAGGQTAHEQDAKGLTFSIDVGKRLGESLERLIHQVIREIEAFTTKNKTTPA